MPTDKRSREAAKLVDTSIGLALDVAKLTSFQSTDPGFLAGIAIGRVALEWLIEQIGYDNVKVKMAENGVFIVDGRVQGFKAENDADGVTFIPEG